MSGAKRVFKLKYVFAVYDSDGLLANICDDYPELMKFFPEYGIVTLRSLVNRKLPLYDGNRKYSVEKINRADL